MRTKIYLGMIMVWLLAGVAAGWAAVPATGNGPRIDRYVGGRDQSGRRNNDTDVNMVEGTLWPGESFTYKQTGLKLSWEMGRADSQTSAPGGMVVIQGAKTTKRIPIEEPPAKMTRPVRPGQVPSGLPIPNQPPQPQIGAGFGEGYFAKTQGRFYLDDTVVNFEVEMRPLGTGKIQSQYGMKYWFYFQPRHFESSAAPFNSSLLYISADCPLTAGDLSLSVSDAPVAYPDGSKMYQLQIRNGTTSESVTMPAAMGTTRRVGRYDIGVDTIYDLTRTVSLKIEGQADPRVMGGDSYLASSLKVRGDMRLEETLEAWAKQYRFSVEWSSPVAGHPEAIDYVKNLKPRSDSTLSGSVLRDALEYAFNYNKSDTSDDYVAVEWKDAGHVRVWAKNYDRVIARQEEEAKKKEAAKLEQAEREKELAAFKEDFAKKYKGEMQIYTLKKGIAETLRPIVQQELSAFYLVAVDQLPGGPGAWKAEVVEKGKFFGIVRMTIEASDVFEKNVPGQMIGDSFRETVVIDDKTGLAVAKVAKATQARLNNLLENLNSLLGGNPMKPKPRQYRIELTLLTAEKATTQTAAKYNYSPKDATVTFEGKEYVYQESFSNVPNYWTVYYLRKDLAKTTNVSPRPPYTPGKTWVVEHVALKGGVNDEHLEVTFISVPIDTLKSASKSATDYGIAPEDLKTMGLDKVRELGRGAVTLAGEAGEIGKATVALNETYRCQLTFQDERAPYLLVKGELIGGPGDKPLLSNTMFLEKGKPALLGLTNLKEALILLVKRTE